MSVPRTATFIDIDFGGGLVNTVYYCHRDATEPALQKVHQIYRDYKDRLEKYYLDVENSDRHADSKAGGSSVAMGLGCLNPGPKRRSKKLAPFLLNTAKSLHARVLHRMVGRFQGVVAQALEELSPAAFADNVKLGQGADDFMYPPQEFQYSGQSEPEIHWFSNQMVVRVTSK